MINSAPLARPKLRGVIHLFGTIVAVPAVIWISISAASGVITTGTVIYGIGLVLLLGISATYHSVDWSPQVYAMLKRIDRSMIFLFIAGSYTPFLMSIGDSAMEVGLPVVWIGALLGVAKTIFWTRPNRWFTAMPYVILGWLGLPFIPALVRMSGPTAITMITIGGVIYTLGAVVYARRWPDPVPTVFGFHEVFHCMVVLGAAAHYVGVWIVVVP